MIHRNRKPGRGFSIQLQPARWPSARAGGAGAGAGAGNPTTAESQAANVGPGETVGRLLQLADLRRQMKDGQALRAHGGALATLRSQPRRARGRQVVRTRGVAKNKDGDYPTDQVTWYRLLCDVGGYHTLTSGKDDLTKTSKLGLNVPPAKPDGRYLQWELGCSDRQRAVGKDDFCGSISKHLGAHEPCGLWLQNQTSRRSDGSALSGFVAICACYNLAAARASRSRTRRTAVR